MTGDLVARTDHAPAVIGANDGQVSDLTAKRLTDAIPEKTREAYAYVIGQFTSWCDDHGRTALPATAQTLAEYVSHMVTLDRAPASIEQAIGIVRGWHKRRGHPNTPDTTAALDLLRGHRRTRAEDGRRVRQAPPLILDELEACIAALDLDTLLGRRDQMVLVFGFYLMARRSELSALRFGEVTETPDGLDVLIRASKNDKQSEGHVRSLPPQSARDLCPVHVLRAWRDALGADYDTGPTTPLLRRFTPRGQVPNGPLSGDGINDVVRAAARRAKLKNADKYTAHSLRAGGITSAVTKGVPVAIAGEHGGWANGSPTPLKYVRRADRWKNNAMRGMA